MSSPDVTALRRLVETDLLPELRLFSRDPHERVVLEGLHAPWELVGTGNYAAVFAHPEHPEWVAKVYAPGRTGIGDEAEVYRRLGRHPAYSECAHAGERFLVLRRLHGVTLYDAVLRGIPIPERVVRDVDEALKYAARRGLRPHDVHGRNVMMRDGHGLVVDVSDFLRDGPCPRWRDLKRGYYWVYRPLVLRLGLRVPERVLNGVRRGHRFFRRLAPKSS
jgi:hypothetical protein